MLCIDLNLKEKHLNKLMEIVGLKHKVDDDINKLIAKFVGVKHREFIEQLEYLMTDYLRELYRSFKIDEDFVIEHHDEIGYLLFHKRVLGNKNCVRCFKNKRKRFSYCEKCDILEFKEYQERCKSYGFGDGCD